MPNNQTKPLVVKIIVRETGQTDRELLWPHSHVPRVGEVISIRTGDDYTVESVTYNLVDHLSEYNAIVIVRRKK